MLDQIRDIEQEALAALAAASDLDALEAVEARTTGKRGALADVLRGIGKLPGDQRTAVGQAANAARKAVEAALEARRTALEAEREAALGTLEALDLTLADSLPVDVKLIGEVLHQPTCRHPVKRKVNGGPGDPRVIEVGTRSPKVRAGFELLQRGKHR